MELGRRDFHHSYAISLKLIRRNEEVPGSLEPTEATLTFGPILSRESRRKIEADWIAAQRSAFLDAIPTPR